VGDGGGLRGAGLDPERLLRRHQALVAGLVEGLVVPAAGVRDHAGLVVARGTAGVAAAAGALLRGRAAGGEGQGAGADQGERTRDALHEGSFDLVRGRERPEGSKATALSQCAWTISAHDPSGAPVRSRSVNRYEID